MLAGTKPLSLASLASSPEGGSPWQGREVSALYRSAGEGDTFRLRQSLSLSGEVARPEAVTERVACGDETSQSRFARQLPRRGSPWQGREVSALYRSAGEGDTFRLRQSLSLSGEVARPKAVTERVCFPDEPSQSRFARQLSRRGEPLAKAAGPSPQVNALHPSTYNQYTFPLCQSLSLSGEVARPKAVTERVCFPDEPSQSRFVRQLPRRGSPALIAQQHKI